MSELNDKDMQIEKLKIYRKSKQTEELAKHRSKESIRKSLSK